MQKMECIIKRKINKKDSEQQYTKILYFSYSLVRGALTIGNRDKSLLEIAPNDLKKERTGIKKLIEC